MYFRPFPILTLVAVPALAALLALGVWQAQRAGWKADQVALFQASLDTPPLTIAQACAAGLAERQIIVKPPAAGETIRVFGHRASGKAGWRLFQVAQLCGRPVLVQTGFEELAIGGPGGQLPTPPEPWPDRYIVEPWPAKPLITAPNAPASNEWHWLDPEGIAAQVNAPDLEAQLLVSPIEGMPDFLVRTPPETHIGYSVTWFGMAIAFVVIYGLFHARAGRLRFGEQARDKAKP